MNQYKFTNDGCTLVIPAETKDEAFEVLADLVTNPDMWDMPAREAA